MEFEISRASIWDEKKPCEEAYKKQIIRIDERRFETFKEHDERLPRDAKWTEIGFNHKIVEPNDTFNTKHIYREFNDEIWCIKINTLKELLNLQHKYGDIILKRCYKNKNIGELEIYDDYIE